MSPAKRKTRGRLNPRIKKLLQGPAHVLVRVEDEIAIVTFSHPPVNALNIATMVRIREIFADLDRHDQVRAVVLTGAGDRAFAAGAEIAELPEIDEASAWRLAGNSQAAMNAIANCRYPVIAAVNGAAVGGGFEAMIACDIRIAVAGARLGLPEVKLGITPASGGTQRLCRLLPLGKAMALLLTGKFITAEEAHAAGLVDLLVPPGQALDRALKLAKEIAANGPIAVQLAKAAARQGVEESFAAGLLAERRAFARCCGSEDKNEGARAFMEKRAARFKGK